MQVEKSWSLVGRIAGEAHLITVYGITSEVEARRLASAIQPVCSRIDMTCAWKRTKYSRWESEKTQIFPTGGSK